MPGNNEVRYVLQARDRRLLGALGTLRAVDREQAKVVAGFHSTTRANTRLLTLTRAGFLTRVAVGTTHGGHKFIYSLSPLGARYVDVPYRNPLRPHTLLAGNLHLEHQLRLNETYLQLAHGARPLSDVEVPVWKTFQQTLSTTTRLIPDAYVEITHLQRPVSMFIEVDMGTESLRAWRRKAQAYLHLATAGEFTRLFERPQFRVLVLLPSERRLATVRRTIGHLTSKIFWFATFESVQGDGFWSASWLRPTGDERRALI